MYDREPYRAVIFLHMHIHTQDTWMISLLLIAIRVEPPWVLDCIIWCDDSFLSTKERHCGALWITRDLHRGWNSTIALSKLWHDVQTDTASHTPTLLSILPRGSFLLSSYSQRLTAFPSCYLNTTQAAWSSPRLGHCRHFSRQWRANVVQLVGQI